MLSETKNRQNSTFHTELHETEQNKVQNKCKKIISKKKRVKFWFKTKKKKKVVIYYNHSLTTLTRYLHYKYTMEVKIYY